MRDIKKHENRNNLRKFADSLRPPKAGLNYLPTSSFRPLHR